MIPELPVEAVSHLYPVLMILGVVIVVLGGIVAGLWQGWQAVIGQIKGIIAEHEVREDAWQKDISRRLSRLERNVSAIRDRLIASDIIEVSGPAVLGEDDTQP